MPFFEKELQHLLRPILENQNEMLEILEEIKKMASSAVTQAQFTADLGALQTLITKFASDVAADVADLKAQIAAGQPADFTSLDQTVQAITSAVTAADATVQPTPPANPAPPAAA